MRRLALSLPRSEEHFIRGRVKFRVGSIVYLAFSRDEEIMGFAFPKSWRAALIEAEPDKFQMPDPSDERFNWVHVRLEAIDEAEMRALVTEAWRMVVPKKVASAHLDTRGRGGGADRTTRRRSRRPSVTATRGTLAGRRHSLRRTARRSGPTCGRHGPGAISRRAACGRW